MYLLKNILRFTGAIWLVLAFSPSVSAHNCDLHELIDKRQYQQATECINEGRADPNQKNAQGQAPLNRYHAFSLSRAFYLNPVGVELVTTLIEKGADVNYRPSENAQTPLEHLLAEGAYEERHPIIALMLAHGGDMQASIAQLHYPDRMITPYLWAIKHHQHATLDLLLSKGQDIYAVPDPRLASPFMHAVHYGNLHAIDQLAAHGGHKHDSALSIWQGFVRSNVEKNKSQTLNSLIDLNIKVDWQDVDQQTQYNFFSNVYKLSTLDSHQDIVRLIAHLGFELDADQNLILWQMAVDLGVWGMIGEFAQSNVEVRRYLMSQPDVLHWQDPNGQTLYHAMIRPGILQVDQAQAFSEAGLNPNVADNQGNTPLHLTAQALLENHQTIEKYRAMPPEERRPKGVELIPQELNSFFRHALSRDLLREYIDYQKQLLRYYDWLVEQGLDPNQANDAGETPRDQRLVLTLQVNSLRP